MLLQAASLPGVHAPATDGLFAILPSAIGCHNIWFVMTTATDHKNNLNRSVLKKEFARALRVETIANSAGGTAQVAIVA